MPTATPNAPFLDTPYYSAWDEDVNSSVGTKRVLIKLKNIATDADPDRDTANAHPGPPKARPRANRPTPDDDIDLFDKADALAVQRWLKKLGESAAKYVVKSAVEARGQRWARSCSGARLEGLPHGYKLWVHKKGHRHAPRQDYYLYGSHDVLRFRSINEFAPHLEWLMKGQPYRANGTRNCECQYCDVDVAGQQEINQRRHPKVSIATMARGVATRPRKQYTAAGATDNGALPHKWMEDRQTVTVNGQTIYYKDYTKLHKPTL